MLKKCRWFCLSLAFLYAPMSTVMAEIITAVDPLKNDDSIVQTVNHVAPQAQVSFDGMSLVSKMGFGLLLVTGLIVILAWLAKRMGGGYISSNYQLKVLATLSLGAREKAVLVDVCGDKILLGVSPGSLSKLHYLAQPSVASDEKITEQQSLRLAEKYSQSTASSKGAYAYIPSVVSSIFYGADTPVDSIVDDRFAESINDGDMPCDMANVDDIAKKSSLDFSGMMKKILANRVAE